MDMIILATRKPTLKTRIVLRTIFSAGVLAALLLMSTSASATDPDVTIIDAPAWYPKAMSYSYYSPGLEIGYSGLQTKSYTLKVWLLERNNWNCASPQICERTCTIENTVGDNPSGTILIDEPLCIHDYDTFDLVVRLYDDTGIEVSWTERYATGTTNRPPQLSSIGDKAVLKNSHLEFTISSTDPDGDGLTYSANDLPSGASFNSTTGTFSWTPTTAGNYPNTRFRTIDDDEGNLYDSEYITITVQETEPQLNVTPCSLYFGNKATSLTFNITNTGAGTLNWAATDDQDWLTVSPTSESTTSEVDTVVVTVNRTGLAMDSYSGMVNITSDGGNQNIPISMTTTTLKGMCYGPFRDGQNPNWGPYPSETNISEDLSIIRSTWAGSIRTYGVCKGLEKIIPIANEFDLNVSPGAWICSNLDSNEEEVNNLTYLAQNYDVETAIVGTEVILRYENGWDNLSKAELIDYITIVKENVSVPVTTYVIERYKQIQNKYPKKKVVIGETGWPSDGSPNGKAVPSLQNQKRFMEELLILTEEEGINFYYFEAFDEKWKTEPNGVGPHWGLYYSNRRYKHLPEGDLNGDDRITPADAAIALEIAAGSRPCDTSDARVHADVSGDRRVTSLDALMILQAAAGAIKL
jgi:exo-beta-1,3-glucanase (GH17 family)